MTKEKKMKAKAKAKAKPKKDNSDVGNAGADPEALLKELHQEEPKPEEPILEDQTLEASGSKSGRVDELGKWYMDEIDFLKWANSTLRVSNLNLHADKLRTKIENLRLDYEANRVKFLNQADAFEKAAKKRRDEDHAKLMEEMGNKYGVDFSDANIVLDDNTGEIKLIDPSKGYPLPKNG
jgi:hypothetical protein